MARRIHYIDWLRVLAVLLLFPFHTGRVFNAGDPFYVKAATTSVAVSYVLAFIDRWHMPLLFLLAGASTLLAMRKRTAGEYLGERAKRLLIPLGFGLLLLIPPQTFVGARFNSGYASSFVHYITSGDFLVWNIRDAGDYYGGFGVGHLWFILFLFIVSLLALPLVLWARGDRGREAVARWAKRLSRPAWWLLPPALIFVGEALPAVAGKNAFYYLVFFVLGFVTMADEGFAESAERHRWPALVAGLLLSAGYVATGSVRNALPDPSVVLALINFAGFAGIWLALVGFLGAGRRYLDRPSPTLAYLAEASYPVYILHQTVIVLLAAGILLVPTAWGTQMALLFTMSVAVTFGLYELARRFSVTRFVLGMRPEPAPIPQPEPEPNG
jgi:glucans biosynthesis protein C